MGSNYIKRVILLLAIASAAVATVGGAALATGRLELDQGLQGLARPAMGVVGQLLQGEPGVASLQPATRALPAERPPSGGTNAVDGPPQQFREARPAERPPGDGANVTNIPPTIAELISAGIERDASGRVTRAFGFDPAPAREIFYSVTRQRPLPADYAPRDLVWASAFGVPGEEEERQVRRILAANLAEMHTASGRALTIISGYRSYSYQAWIFNRLVIAEIAAGADRASAEARTSQTSADPGHSEHQLGLAIDFNALDESFATTRVGRWLTENAWRYGFVMSYTRQGEARSGYGYEPWHWRWVGVPLASLMMQQGYLTDDRRIPNDYYEAVNAVLQKSPEALQSRP